MPDIPMCEHRRVELGRLYCDVATRRGDRGTDETYNVTCAQCRVGSIRAAHPCAHLDIGVDLTEHRDRSTLDHYHLACRIKKIDVEDAVGCTPECPTFEVIEEARRAEYEVAGRARDEVQATQEEAKRTVRRLDL